MPLDLILNIHILVARLGRPAPLVGLYDLRVEPELILFLNLSAYAFLELFILFAMQLCEVSFVLLVVPSLVEAHPSAHPRFLLRQ